MDGIGMNALAAFGMGRDERTRREVGNALAQGNYQGAQQAAYRGGDASTGMQIGQFRQAIQQEASEADEQRRAQLGQLYSEIGRTANALRAVPVEQRGSALMASAGRFAPYGATPDMLQQYAEALSDPSRSDGVLAALSAAAVDADEVFSAYAPRTLDAGDTVMGYEGGRPATLAENVDQVGLQNARTRAFEAQTGRMGAETGRMAEQRLQDAAQREAAGVDDQARRAQALASRFTRNTLVLEDIGRAIEGAGQFGTTGLLGQVMSPVGGTGARNLEALIDTVRANIGFDELQRMRDMSPTGGALGQVTERELAQLQAVLGNLETSQGQAQLQQNLTRLQQVYQTAQRNIAEAYRQDFGVYPEGYGGQSGSNPPASGQSASDTSDPLGIRG